MLVVMCPFSQCKSIKLMKCNRTEKWNTIFSKLRCCGTAYNCILCVIIGLLQGYIHLLTPMTGARGATLSFLRITLAWATTIVRLRGPTDVIRRFTKSLCFTGILLMTYNKSMFPRCDVRF